MNTTDFTTVPSLAHGEGPIVRAEPPSPSTQLLAGALLLSAGLALIVLGGCFLYGVLEAVRANQKIELGYKIAWMQAPGNTTYSWTDSTASLQGVLYGLAGLCFIGATVLLFLGGRGLVRIMRGNDQAGSHGRIDR